MPAPDPLKGKKMGIIGDSYVRNHREPVENTWHYKFARKHQMEYYNYGRNGNCIALDLKQWGTGMYKRYEEMRDDLDYVVVIAGHNDASQGRLDSIGIDTFKERLGILCRGLIEKYPRARLYVFTPWTCDGFVGSPRQQVVDAMLEVCGSYGIPVFDAAHERTVPQDILPGRQRHRHRPPERPRARPLPARGRAVHPKPLSIIGVKEKTKITRFIRLFGPREKLLNLHIFVLGN